MEERLQKIIARAGVASRRHAEERITSGLVTVNGVTVTKLGSKADAARDHIKVNGKLLPQTSAERVYLLLNKPAEVVSTMSDPEGRRSLQDLLYGVSERVFPVGRLEYHSSGLVFLTNDGDLANKIIQSHGLPQTYQMKLKNLLTFAEIEVLARKTGAHITRLKGQDNPWYEVTLTESRRDALRGLLFQSGHPVEKIKRVRIGKIELDKLAPGQHRMLSSGEVAALRRSAEAPPAAAAAPSVERTEAAAPETTFAPREGMPAPVFTPRVPVKFAAGAYKKPPRFDRARSSDRPASPWKGPKHFGKGAHTPGRPAFRGPSNPPNPRERFEETRKSSHASGRPGLHGPSRPRDNSTAAPPGKFRSGGAGRPGSARPPKPFDKPRRDFRGPSSPAGPRPTGPRENSGHRNPGAPGRFGKARPGNDRPSFAKKSGARGPASNRPTGNRPPRRPHSGKPSFPRRDRT